MSSHSLPLALSLALGAAILHAAWNILLKTSGDPLDVSTRAISSAVVLVSPLAAVAWLASGRPDLPPKAWLLAAVSAVVELIYLMFLSRGYERGDLSLVYPIARGTAPLLAVPVGLLLLGERLSTCELLGVGLLLAGIWLIQSPAIGREALLPALLTGVAIATYSAIDRVGVRLAPPWLYGFVLWVMTAALLRARQRLARWRAPVGSVPGGSSQAQAIVVGLLMTITYLLILIALSFAPLAVVAPVRESAIVLVTVWGIWRLGERQGASIKLLGAAATVAGIVLVAIG